jgi:septation ring formation regulator EzrA
VQALLAKNLDGALFREELARLADELVQLREGLEEERGQAAAFEKEARAWIAKLEQDVASLKAELEREVEARRAFAEENRRLREASEALQRLPGLLRRYLLKRVRDARG